MAKENKQTSVRAVVIVSATLLAAIMVVAGCKKEPQEPSNLNHHGHEHTSPESATDNTGNPKEAAPATAREPKLRLRDVIAAARSWGPAYASWYGKTAPDFALTDITGKEHKLSNYRGKNVMITFWASWCRPCKVELPHLIALRNTVSEDELVMLAISYNSIMPPENLRTVKKFVEENKGINYPVFSCEASAMPVPYSTVNSIPSSFFIKPDGTIKLATSGLLTLGYMKAILAAE
jgi:peroxiredoxin